jgi:hypothetical protein
LDASGFPPEGDDCDARCQVQAFNLGWKQFLVYGYRGQRFTGCGFGLESDGVRIDVYGSSGDYLPRHRRDGSRYGNAQDLVR